MNSGRTIFAQLMDLLPLAEFRRCVDRYQGDYKVQSFSCLDQFLSLAFAQLTYRESLRDIETCLRAHQPPTLSHGLSGRRLAQHPGQRQPAARLAHLRRFRPPAHRAGPHPLSARTVRGGIGPDGLRLRFHHHRSVLVAFSLGAVSAAQECGEASHLAGPARQHSDRCLRDQRTGERCETSRSTGAGSRSLLSPRSRAMSIIGVCT